MASTTPTVRDAALAGTSGPSHRQAQLSLAIPEGKPKPIPETQNSARPVSPRRIFSDPLPPSLSATDPPSLPFSNAKSPIEKEHPHSASTTSPRTLRFGSFSGFGRGDGVLEKSKTTPAPVTRKGSMGTGRFGDGMKRRHSSEARMNVHTECGRHSDDWLFGGFSVTGAVKKLSRRKDSKGKEIIEENEEE
ncbi:hypothetical protein B0O99DRAFT_592461 [Bisporella sp. PMI_857]|nr:hypothetical protein B0O99DRAFT_592461 [Bisporella sp. PMI_857]